MEKMTRVCDVCLASTEAPGVDEGWGIYRLVWHKGNETGCLCPTHYKQVVEFIEGLKHQQGGAFYTPWVNATPEEKVRLKYEDAKVAAVWVNDKKFVPEKPKVAVRFDPDGPGYSLAWSVEETSGVWVPKDGADALHDFMGKEHG